MTVQEMAPPLEAGSEGSERGLPVSSLPDMSRLKPTRSEHSPLLGRVLRYAGTSVASTVASELVLLALFGFHLATAAEAAVAATVVGGMLSYLLSRYWIWAEADRRRPGRQFVFYWGITILGLLASTWVTSEAAAHIAGQGPGRTALVGLAYLGTYAVLWVLKFGLYQRVLFRPMAPPSGAPA
ncbi:MAG: hypothetical protein M0027_03335 [Candidatus Dormibacteraeota bacterium]|nr:hypothetical protein [Candidatus Dormibacteraeota bacterium]